MLKILTKHIRLNLFIRRIWHHFLLWCIGNEIYHQNKTFMYLKSIKNLLLVSLISFGIAACNSKKSDSRDIQLLSDSSAYHNNMSTDSAKLSGASSGSHQHGNSGNSASSSNKGSNASSSNSGSNSSSGTSTSATHGTDKKGWSKAAQGAVIGGATGAVGGAIISKKKGTGAAIGAAVGAAGGYIIGREKDKKDGRVKKKE